MKAAAIVLFVGLFSGAFSSAGEFALDVVPSAYPLQVSVPLPDDIELTAGSYCLIAPDAAPMPAQIVALESASGTQARRLVATLAPASGMKPRRMALKARTEALKPAFSFSPLSDRSLELSEGDRRVWVFNHGSIGREGVPPRYDRSNYFHPVFGPAGETLTDDFPKDHYHHRGLFWAWTTVQVAGLEDRKYESWIPNDFRYIFERWRCREAGSVAAVLGAEFSWQTGERKTVREEWVVTVFPETADGRAMDFEIVWTALKDAVTVKGEPKKGYGGFSIRYAPRKDKTTVITTSEGRSPKDLEAGRIAWADLSGLFEGAREPSGAAIFVDPAHPGSPLTWLTSHYGFLCPEYPGLGEMTLEPGKPVRVAYRVWIHKGVPGVAALQAQDEAYRQGLTAKLAVGQ